MSHKFTDAAPRNPFDITITKSPLYREPETDMGDLLGERRATQQQIDVLNRAADTPEVRAERERIAADKERLESGYFRHDASGHRLYIGPLSTYPTADQGKEEK